MARIGVDILGNPTSLLKAFRKSEVAAAEFNGRMNKLGQATRGALSQSGSKTSFLFGSTQFVAAAITTAAIVKSVKAASDLNEEITKSRQIFKGSADQVRAWSRTTADSIGVSQTAALQFTGIFGNLLRTVNLAPAEAAKMSQSLVQLGADLASFNNTSIDDALLAIRSGLVGEAEPLRRFGVLLSESRVQQQAMADTGKKTAKALTDQEKALARYELILKDTAPAQGDFARTSDGLANQLRILRANLSDLAATSGTKFLPAVNATVHGLNNFISTGHLFTSIEDQLTAKIAENAQGMKNALPALEAYREGIAKIKGDSDALVQSLDNVIGKLVEQKFALSDASRGEGRTAQSVVASNAQVDARNEAEAIARAKAERKRLQKQFDELSKGLGLKLDKAQLTGSVDAQLAVLREFEAAIQRQERRVGKTFDLESALTNVRQQIKDLQDQKISDALDAQAKKTTDAIQRVVDAFDIKLGKAQLTATVTDDIKVLQEELAAIRKLQEANKNNQDLKVKEVDLEQQILTLKKQQTAETKAQFDAARSRADSLFGTLFQAQEQAQRTLTILGGSKGKQTVVLPGAGGGEDARGLLSDLTTQIKSFKTLQANILELQRKGAPKSLIEAARSGEISADQINALASANTKTLNQIFKNVRLADKLVSKAAKAEINARDVNLHANTVTLRGVVNAGSVNSGHRDNGDIVIHVTTNVDGKKVDNAIERHRKKRTQQTRGRAGGKR